MTSAWRSPSDNFFRTFMILAALGVLLGSASIALTLISNGARIDDVEILAGELKAQADASATLASSSQTSRFKNGVTSCEDKVRDRVAFAALIDDITPPSAPQAARDDFDRKLERRLPTDLDCQDYSAQRVCRSKAERATAPCLAFTRARRQAGREPWPPSLDPPAR